MIVLMALLAQTPSAAAPPQDWSALPPLELRTTTDAALDPSDYVRNEVEAGRCGSAVQTARGRLLRIDLAVFGTAQGRVLRVVPRAINCPTVEQFAAGLVSRMARDNINTHGARADGWYRTTLTFSWDR